MLKISNKIHSNIFIPMYLLHKNKKIICEIATNKKLFNKKQYKKTTDYLENILSSSNDEGLIKRLNSVSKQLSKILKLEKPKNE